MNDMNPKNVIVDTTVYENSHGKTPRGRGMWAFSPVRNPESSSDRNEIYFTSGSYGEAKKAAQCRFAGKVVIYVQP